MINVLDFIRIAFKQKEASVEECWAVELLFFE
jgi:hypothetical protein